MVFEANFEVIRHIWSRNFAKIWLLKLKTTVLSRSSNGNLSRESVHKVRFSIIALHRIFIFSIVLLENGNFMKNLKSYIKNSRKKLCLINFSVFWRFSWQQSNFSEKSYLRGQIRKWRKITKVTIIQKQSRNFWRFSPKSVNHKKV